MDHNFFRQLSAKNNEGEDTRIFQKKIPQENTIGYEVDLENTEKKLPPALKMPRKSK